MACRGWDLKSTGPRGPWGFESLALRHSVQTFTRLLWRSYCRPAVRTFPGRRQRRDLREGARLVVGRAHSPSRDACLPACGLPAVEQVLDRASGILLRAPNRPEKDPQSGAKTCLAQGVVRVDRDERRVILGGDRIERAGRVPADLQQRQELITTFVGNFVWHPYHNHFHFGAYELYDLELVASRARPRRPAMRSAAARCRGCPWDG
jgi:hypothetical protein